MQVGVASDDLPTIASRHLDGGSRTLQVPGHVCGELKLEEPTKTTALPPPPLQPFHMACSPCTYIQITLPRLPRLPNAHQIGMPDSTCPQPFTHAAIYCLSVAWHVLGSFCSEAAGGEQGKTWGPLVVWLLPDRIADCRLELDTEASEGGTHVEKGGVLHLPCRTKATLVTGY